MDIRKATLSDLSIIKRISEVTISEIYPHYYPKGAVDFFLEHHSKGNILGDIKKGLSISALTHRKTLLEQSQLRIMRYVGFLSCRLIKIRGLVRKCLILLKKQSFSIIQKLYWTLRCPPESCISKEATETLNLTS